MTYGNFERPDPPVIKYVTIDSITGDVKIKWEHSPSPDVVKYYIYKNWTQIGDTAYYPADSIIFEDNYNEYANYYVVAVTISPEPKEYYSVGGTVHNSMSLNVKYDSCSSAMVIRWNTYRGWGESLVRYNIYDQNNNKLLGAGKDTFFIHQHIQEKRNYKYYVEAVHKNGTLARSYAVEKFTSMAVRPEYIDLSVSDSGNIFVLNYFIDPASEIKHYFLKRSINKNSDYEVIGEYQHNPGSEGFYLDTAASLVGTRYYYRLYAINTCDSVVKISNTASNLVLQAKQQKQTFTNMLEWNSPIAEEGGINNYIVYLQDGQDHTKLATITENNYSHDFSSSKDDSTTSKFCYHVEAEQIFSESGNKIKIRSNTKCVVVIPQLAVPNAFTPHNNDGINDEFKPLLRFLPKDYYFSIYNRWGNKVFETTDPHVGWDGNVNGQPAEEGVYIYFITYKNFNDFVYNKKGHVTLINQ